VNDDRFGSSLALEDGDLVLGPDGSLGQVHGLPNLEQALTLRLLTPYGSDLAHATYGLDARRAFTEGHTRRMVEELIRLEIVRSLATDPRVDDVVSVEFDAATAPHDRLRKVTVVVRTVQASTAQLLIDVEVT
jgi:phage baseplate assembly protein W